MSLYKSKLKAINEFLDQEVDKSLIVKLQKLVNGYKKKSKDVLIRKMEIRTSFFF